jgi:hypothetical protein
MVRVSCSDKEWKDSLAEALRHGKAVELSDLDYTKNGAICEKLATQYNMDLFFIAREHVGRFSAAPLKQ